MAVWETVQSWPRDEARLHQDRKLSKYLADVVYPHSPHYRDLFDRKQLSPHDIRGREDLSVLPFSSKADLLPTEEEPQRYRRFILDPDREHLSSKWSNRIKALYYGREHVRAEVEREFRPVFLTATTGRSAEPVAFLYSRHDIDNLKESGRRLIEITEGRSDMKGINLFPYAPHLAFWQVVFAHLTYGMLVVSTGGGKLQGTDATLGMIERLKPEVLIGMPSFLYHVLREANTRGTDLSSVQKLILGGEAVSRQGRQKLIERVQRGGGNEVHVMATYGFTEARMAWPECPGPPGEPTGYHYYPDMNLFELRDPETGATVPHEQGGEMVYTPLNGRASVVLRYRTGDLCEGIDWGECPHCGRTLPRIRGPIQRVSRIQNLKLEKVKGTLVNFNSLQKLLGGHSMLKEWQVEFRKKNDDPMEVDEVHLHVSLRDEIEPGKARRTLNRDIRQETEFTPNEIHIHDQNTMIRRIGLESKLKETRFLDNRPGGEE